MDKGGWIKDIDMTNIEKQLIINRCQKDFVYFAEEFLEMNFTSEQKEFIKRIQNGNEQLFIRAKINEKLSSLKNNAPGSINIPAFNFKPKNGAKIDLTKIIEDNNKDLKL